MSQRGIKNVFGSASVQKDRGFSSPELLEDVYKTLEQGNVDTIDTATIYGASQEFLGNTGAPKRFTIDTKAPGGLVPNTATKNGIIKTAEESKKLLKTNQVDIWYLHGPDRSIPLEETLAGVYEVYKSGWFKRFGLSNFFAEDVQRVYDICKEKGYPLPSVYQGNYNAVARKQEEVLFPTLRKLGIAFYAYSPIAGGFLVKTKEQIAEGKGRWDTSTPVGRMYAGLYAKPSYLEALAKWDAIAKDEGVTKADLAYRWVKYNSPLKRENGDAIIIGASSVDQLKETLGSIGKGPLSDKASKAIDNIWEGIKHEAGLDNING